MNKINKLYLSLGLLLSIESMSYTCENQSTGKEIIADVDQETTDKTQQEIDQELYDVFGKFFDEKDTTPFYKIVKKVIAILKLKRTTLQGDDLAKCNDIIKLLEQNKYNAKILVWANILKSQDLIDLLSPETLAYLNGIPNPTKLKTLIYKLKNNNSYSFF